MKRLIALVTVAFFCLFCGCDTEKGADGISDKSAKQANGEGAAFENSGNEDIAVFSYKPDTFCPVLSTNRANNDMLGMVFDSLISLDEKMTPQPCLAKGWSAAEDFSVWKIELRSDAAWHDGDAFCAKDVVYTVNQIASDENSPYNYNVSNIKSIRAVGQSGVEITLLKPQSTFMNLLYFPIIKNSGKNVDKESYKPNGTGAYRFEDRNEGNVYYLVRNEKWWGSKPKTEVIKVKMLPDSDTALYAFSSGNIDMAKAESPDWGKFVDRSSDYAEMETPIFSFMGINHKNAVLGCEEVRRAISKVIDREKICQEAFMSCAEAAGAPTRAKWSVGQKKNFSVNTDEARRILKSGEWAETDGGYKKTIGKRRFTLGFNLLINEENSVRKNIADIIKQNLGNFGIKVTVTSVSFEEYERRIASGRYDAFIGSVAVPADFNLDFFIGEGNHFGFENEEISEKAKSAMAAEQGEALSREYKTLSGLFEKENPVIGLLFENTAVIYSKALKDRPQFSYYNLYKGIENVSK